MSFVLLLLVVVLVGLAGAGLLGIGTRSDDRRRSRSGLLAALLALAVVMILAVLGVMAVGLGGGAPGGDPGDAPGDAAAGPATTVTSRPSAAPEPLPSSRLEPVTTDLPVVRIQVSDEDRFSAYEPVSGLGPGGVVRVRGEGFDWFEGGTVEQCVVELGRHTACGPAFPVQFDDEGEADFQLGIRGDLAPGGCRVGQPTCLLRLTGDDTGRRGTAQIVLEERFVPGRVVVEPAGSLADGQTVEISVTGFPAGSPATAVLCAPPDAYDARRCARPERTSTFAIDADGAGRTQLAVAAGRLGPDEVLCGPRRLCAVVVVVGPGFVAAPPAPIAFSLGPGVAYDADRVVPGVLVALVFAALALVIAVRTDWTKPTEAATPALDRADLRADQNLDQLFGTDEEIDERDPIPS